MKHLRTLALALIAAAVIAVPGAIFAEDYTVNGITITVGAGAPWKQKITPAKKIVCTLMIDGQAAITANITVEPSPEGQSALQSVILKGADLKEIKKKDMTEEKKAQSGADQVAIGLFEGRTGEFGTLQQAFVTFVLGDKMAVVEFIGMKDKFEKAGRDLDKLLDSLKFKRVP